METIHYIFLEINVMNCQNHDSVKILIQLNFI
jgi:hypothetical protein